MKVTRNPLTGRYPCANCGSIQCGCTDSARIDAVAALLQALTGVVLEMRVLSPPDEVKRLKGVIRAAVDQIDWNEQNASCYSIGEDGAEPLLMALGFPWEKGVNNESIETFLKESR